MSLCCFRSKDPVGLALDNVNGRGVDNEYINPPDVKPRPADTLLDEENYGGPETQRLSSKAKKQG